MPPPAGIAGVSSLMLATTDSVVRRVDATLVAFCSALLVTFADPGYQPRSYLHTLPCMHRSHPALGDSFTFVNDNGAFQTCVCGDVEQRSLQSFQDDLSAGLLIALQTSQQP